jgi:hypothetical protein
MLNLLKQFVKAASSGLSEKLKTSKYRNALLFWRLYALDAAPPQLP